MVGRTYQSLLMLLRCRKLIVKVSCRDAERDETSEM